MLRNLSLKNVIQKKYYSPRRMAPQFFLTKEQKNVNRIRDKKPSHLSLETRKFLNETLLLIKDDKMHESGLDTESFGQSEIFPLITRSDVSSLRNPAYGIKRCGAIGVKIGVCPLWNSKGQLINSTMVQILDNSVLDYVAHDEPHDDHMVKKSQLKKFGINYVGAFTRFSHFDPDSEFYQHKKIIRKFHVDPAYALPEQYKIDSTYFEPGDFLDVCGKTIDHGFQGVVKRWGFKGGPASHGCTKFHRRPGSIGDRSGIVHKGKKMPGQMGGKMTWIRGVKILRINYEYDVLYIQLGTLPGPTGSVLELKDTYLPNKSKKVMHKILNKNSPNMPRERYAPGMHDLKKEFNFFNKQ